MHDRIIRLQTRFATASAALAAALNEGRRWVAVHGVPGLDAAAARSRSAPSHGPISAAAAPVAACGVSALAAALPSRRRPGRVGHVRWHPARMAA
jgi:hypothetical protein